MKKAKTAFILVLLSHLIGIACLLQAQPTPRGFSESDLNRLEKELEDPAKRIAALAAVIGFAAEKLYTVGGLYAMDRDPTRNALRDRAVLLARKHTGIDIVSGALDSADPQLNLWGLWCWRGGIQRAQDVAERQRQEQSRDEIKGEVQLLEAKDGPAVPISPVKVITGLEQSWLALIPKIRQFAKDSPYRGQAIDDLAYGGPDELEFLKGLVATEPDASLVLRLLDITDKPNRDARFNDEVLRRLSDPDIKVRTETLGAIGFQWNKAEMWQVRFDVKVLRKVIELQNSSDPEERERAERSLTGLNKLVLIWVERDQNKSHVDSIR